jgi:hypothetical protein
VARVLVVGCGCRGRQLTAALTANGLAVRGTSRSRDGLRAIEAAGAEGVVADPDRLATLMPHVEGASVVCWLMGDARGDSRGVAAVHGPRLESFLAELVDTPVRGFVYEAAGGAGRELLREGAGIVRSAGARHRIAVQVVEQEPADCEAWLTDMTRAVDLVLSGA